MSASLAFWIILFLVIVVLPIAGWLTYRCLNWRGLVRYREPEGNQLFDCLGANPYRGRYS